MAVAISADVLGQTKEKRLLAKRPELRLRPVTNRIQFKQDKGKHPMSEENKAVSRRFHAAIGKGSAHAVQEELAPNFVAHFPGVPVPLDAEGFKQLINVFGSAFPQSHFDIDDEFAVGDKVVTRWTYHAVHSGEFQGLPPTGKQVTMTGITILRIAGGKIVENTVELDQLGLLRQLGVVPPPPG